MIVGSLFSGIGGFDLGFQRSGFEIAWQVENDAYCQKVLAKNFPSAKRFGDIREVGSNTLAPVDVICGGFPCQDISNAGKRAGIEGDRSGLWSEMFRVVSELRPEFVIVENVAALLGRGIDRVLGDLSEIGYDAEWEIVSAADMGAPHLRKRVWIVAYPEDGLRRKNGGGVGGGKGSRERETCERTVRARNWGAKHDGPSARGADGGEGDVADTERSGIQESTHPGGASETRARIFTGPCIAECDWWAVEPDVGRVAHGIPSRVDRLKGLGNALVPPIAELIAKRILVVQRSESLRM